MFIALVHGIFLFPRAIFCFDRAAVLTGANDIKKLGAVNQ
jgi:hypothetical protein